MDEQSHKEEMRAALRGDFERLRARRGSVAATLAEKPSQDVTAGESHGAGDTPTGDAPHRGWMTRLLDRC